MRIIVDADATPSLKEIVEISENNNIECHLFCDYSHNFDCQNAKIHYISSGFQMVDIAISNYLSEDDILITQDYGLALIALTKKAKAIGPNGIIYTNDNIDILLKQRYINLLNQNKKVHIKKRTKEIEQKFLANLQKLIAFNK